MKQIIISGASGDLGRRVTQLLLDDPRTRTLRLVTRTPDALRAQLADSHPSADVTVVHGDFEDPTSLDEAYRGGGTLLLISGLNIGRRVPEHQTAVAAAARAGVSHVVYTSVGGVQSGNPALSARDHQQSERDLIGSGLPHTILRNALYAEIVSNVLVAPGVQHGTIVQATGPATSPRSPRTTSPAAPPPCWWTPTGTPARSTRSPGPNCWTSTTSPASRPRCTGRRSATPRSPPTSDWRSSTRWASRGPTTRA